jgi:hypothetical protein
MENSDDEIGPLNLTFMCDIKSDFIDGNRYLWLFDITE